MSIPSESPRTRTRNGCAAVGLVMLGTVVGGADPPPAAIGCPPGLPPAGFVGGEPW